MREGSPPQPCHMSHVTCQVSYTKYKFVLYIFFGRSSEASLPRLVLHASLHESHMTLFVQLTEFRKCLS